MYVGGKNNHLAAVPRSRCRYLSVEIVRTKLCGFEFTAGRYLNPQCAAQAHFVLSANPSENSRLRYLQGPCCCCLAAEMIDKLLYNRHSVMPPKRLHYRYAYENSNSYSDLRNGTSAATIPRMETLQQRLKSARLAVGLSQGEVAKRAKISQPTYSDLERIEGKGSRYLVRIANVLGVNPDWLASGHGPRDRNKDIAGEVDLELLELWRELSEEQRRMLLTMIRAAANEHDQ